MTGFWATIAGPRDDGSGYFWSASPDGAYSRLALPAFEENGAAVPPAAVVWLVPGWTRDGKPCHLFQWNPLGVAPAWNPPPELAPAPPAAGGAYCPACGGYGGHRIGCPVREG